MAAALLVGGCSNSTDKKKEPGTDVTAGRLCDGTLDAPARSALLRLAGTDRFDESAGGNGSDLFSVRYAVRHLHDEYERQGVCLIYTSGDGSDHPLLDIQFSADESYAKAADGDSGSGRQSLGVYTRTGRDGVDVFFRCATKAPSGQSPVGDTKYVKAEMYSPAGRLRGEHQDADRLAILGSMSRAVAREAGCASGAGLDEGRTGS
ncbi:hypothetical protein [Streptomyces sp. NPDC091385]|uniref:hypothetical protein n=1 Tax=Streptomyces sp. NPDC091385 TaxID=3365997 RepID=UPI00382D6F4B